MKVLVTGAAGFIGFYLVRALVEAGHTVVGIDNLNDYYPVSLKLARLRESGIEEADFTRGHAAKSRTLPGYTFLRLDITDRQGLDHLCDTEKFDIYVNLAAQAGVRYSIDNPYAYIQSNVVGFVNLLEAARRNPPRLFLYASSSSVYGGNEKTPFAESDRVDAPVSLYAATKKSDELMANVYSHLYGLRAVGLRFFTVYGPWGRPDMAPMLFADAIREGRPIKVFNNGNLSRDFTYIGDIVAGIMAVIDVASQPDAKVPPVLNIGHGSPVALMDFIGEMEKAFGKEAIKEYLPMQPGDVHTTFADTTLLADLTGYTAPTSLPEGLEAFAAWYDSHITH